MTCIVGIADGGRVVLGGDSAGAGGSLLQLRADTKVFRTQGYVMGFTTSFRMGQLLRYARLPEAPTAEVDWDLDRFMATRFIDAVRQALYDGGWLGKDSMSREEGGTFLVGVRGALYAVYDDFQVGRTINGYASVGSGQQLALGALHATAGLDMMPHDRVEAALLAAADHSTGVSAPFVYEEV